MAHIISICYSPTKTTHDTPYHYTRVPVQQATLIANFGIEGDAKGKKDSSRQLNVMSSAMVAALAADGYKVAPGELGEQIIVDGLDVDSLPVGARLILGEAEIEVTKPRTGCDWFEKIHNLPRPDGRMGVMARVIGGGVIRVGDTVMVEATVTE